MNMRKAKKIGFLAMLLQAFMSNQKIAMTGGRYRQRFNLSGLPPRWKQKRMVKKHNRGRPLK